MMRIAMLVTLAAGACSSTTTAIQIDVGYDDGWGLTAIRVSAGDLASTTDLSHSVTLLVPDDWADTSQSISLVGVRGADTWAQGTVAVVPRRGATVKASAHLALLSCTTSCVEGASVCIAGGLAVCEQRADSCFDFTTPAACGRGTRCASGECVSGDPVVLPSNSQTFGALEQTGITLDIENGYVFDTSADCYKGSALGNCAPVAPAGSPEVCVCRADTVKIHDLEVRGSRALAILAWTSVTVQGDLVITPGTGVAAEYTADGTAGGSYGTRGGNGGAPTFGNAQLVPLAGGMTGQKKTVPLGGAFSGLGGGALQITADQMVRVEGTINVPGGGAPRPTCGSPRPREGGAGGSGGGLLLEARHVDVVGGIAANGGAGASGSMTRALGSDTCGNAGDDGFASATRAAGGGFSVDASCNTSTGSVTVALSGKGGAGSLGTGIGGNSGPASSGIDRDCNDTSGGATGGDGGGGGGAGRIRINTFSDACGCTGFASPTPTYGMVVIE